MIRLIIGIIASLFLVSVVRTVIAAMTREFKEQSAAGAQQQTSKPQPQGPTPIGGELRKCPACGTYHATAGIAGKTKTGELVHFCSVACREKFVAA